MEELISSFELHYWASSGKAEVDLVVQIEGEIYPVEIKSGINLRAKSLLVYDEKYSPSKLIRCSLSNFNRNEKLMDIPLYAIAD